jgi:prepilin-type N-terminal cleavage/methylation domain-containing protein
MSKRRAGFTLIEVMIAMVVLGFVMGAAISVFRSQSTNFRVGGQRLELEQNLRYAVGTLDRVVRTAGAGTTSTQPMFLYGDTVTVAVNADYTDSVTPTNAVYYNPDAPPGSFTALPVGSAYTLPNTAFAYPSMTYLDINGTPGAAETIVIYFRPDSSTADPNDYVMMMRVNALPAELIARNIYKIPNTPFLRYYVHPTTLSVPPATRDSNIVCPSASCSGAIQHTIALHNSAADTSGTGSALADSVKAIPPEELPFFVVNGRLDRRYRLSDVLAYIERRTRR